MTPPPFSAESKPETIALAALSPTASPTNVPTSTETTDTTAPSTPASEKKPVKKRKSWGQVLPEPKTNLPPRKRAKTEDEKEQRRVERVLRNRRAAQSSRERKRQEVEALEKRNKELEARVLSIEKTNLLLLEELNKYRRTTGVVTRSSSPLDSLQSNPVTLTSELFSSQDSHKVLIDQLMFNEPSSTTVDPSSLSPKLSPDVDEQELAAVEPTPVAPATTSASASSTSDRATELTQRPAAMLCDLQCQHSVDLPRSWTTSQMDLVQPRYVLESGLLSSPNSVDFENDYLAGDAAALFPTDLFDISQFLHEDGNGVVSDATAANGQSVAAEAELDLHFADFENHFSSENLNLQPHSGASASGCDDGGIAVGV
ncbi:Transcriptional activator hac1 [Scedosporium apiospermum]|uniref:Transcriptional activator hac1 n=1 Tax=Pseudallescheria apiosperma TaxID=563466 RepID=A0A084G770_PSEDA|nr:Transcriptional activator hac1 [Scedosporium apiospermum]KEZ43182.1 Transcriptional activator hac1 [Scedosporium apiospermum]